MSLFVFDRCAAQMYFATDERAEPVLSFAGSHLRWWYKSARRVMRTVVDVAMCGPVA
jgi:hypothetical protein